MSSPIILICPPLTHYSLRNSQFYQFGKLGDDDDTPEYSSNDFITKDDGTLDVTVYFKPRPLENLLLVDELASMSPLTDAKVRTPTGTAVTYWLSNSPILDTNLNEVSFFY